MFPNSLAKKLKLSYSNDSANRNYCNNSTFNVSNGNENQNSNLLIEYDENPLIFPFPIYKSISDYQYYFLGVEIGESFENLIGRCQQLLDKLSTIQSLQNTQMPNCLSINYRKLKTVSSSFAIQIAKEPRFISKLMCLAYDRNLSSDRIVPSINYQKKYIEITDFDVFYMEPSLEYVEKMISIRGKVVHLEPIDKVWTELVFKCDSCQSFQLVDQLMGKFRLPNRCLSNSCSQESVTFTPMKYHPCNVFVSSQMVTIERKINNMYNYVTVQLTHHLVDTCAIDDTIQVTGILVGQILDANARTNFGVQALHLQRQCKLRVASNSPAMTIESVIKARSEVGDSFELFSASLCPDIFVQNTIKAGLILSFFGAPCFVLDDIAPSRGGIYLLLIDTLGSSTNRLLHDASALMGIIPAGCVFMSSNDAGNAYFGVESILKTKEVLFCIENIEKIRSDIRNKIIQHMKTPPNSDRLDQLQPFQISILASTFFDELHEIERTLYDVLPEDLVRAFDLIFVLKEQVINETKDCLPRFSRAKLSKKSSLEDRLALVREKVPYDFMSQYVAYARANIHPKLTDGTCQFLMKCHRKLILSGSKKSNTTLTFETFCRLCLARARVDLKEVVTRRHVEDVMELVTKEPQRFGKVRGSKTLRGKSASRRMFIKILQDHAIRRKDYSFSMEHLSEIRRTNGLNIEHFSEFIEQLNEAGYLIKKGADTFTLVVAC